MGDKELKEVVDGEEFNLEFFYDPDNDIYFYDVEKSAELEVTHDE